MLHFNGPSATFAGDEGAPRRARTGQVGRSASSASTAARRSCRISPCIRLDHIDVKRDGGLARKFKMLKLVFPVNLHLQPPNL